MSNNNVKHSLDLNKTTRNLTLIFNNVEEVHLGKDVFLFPYYLGKRYGMQVHIVYPQTPTNINMKQDYRGVLFHPLKCDLSDIYDFSIYKSYIEEYAKEIDLLMLFHGTSTTEKLCILYKTLNPSGKCYVKLDVNIAYIPMKTNLRKNLFKYIIDVRRADKFCQLVDYVSVETNAAYGLIKKSKSAHLAFGNKLHIHSNGFDEVLLTDLGVTVKSFDKKENLIITVGRLGTAPKNTSMLLNALKKMNLKGWKVALIGPIDATFEDEVNLFFKENPKLKTNVVFIGPISDKKILWDYYNRAKVFCFTSDWESFGLVLTEAYRFGDYIISTPVGAFNDVVKNNNIGEAVPINDPEALANSLQKVIDGETVIDVYADDNMRRKFSMDRIVSEFNIF